MAEQFVGKWKLVESENFDEFMKEVGIGLLFRKTAGSLKPSVDIKVSGNHWTITTMSSIRNHTVEFDLDKEFEEETPDGRKLECTFSLNGDQLVQTQTKIKNDDKNSIITRKIEGGKMVVIAKSGDVSCKRVYERE